MAVHLAENSPSVEIADGLMNLLIRPIWWTWVCVVYDRRGICDQKCMNEWACISIHFNHSWIVEVLLALYSGVGVYHQHQVTSAPPSIKYFQIFSVIIEETFSHPYIWKFPENVSHFLLGRLFKTDNVCFQTLGICGNVLSFFMVGVGKREWTESIDRDCFQFPCSYDLFLIVSCMFIVSKSSSDQLKHYKGGEESCRPPPPLRLDTSVSLSTIYTH